MSTIRSLRGRESSATTWSMTGPMPKSWESWYRFAQEELGLERDEAIEYANARYVEEQNRARLRGERADVRAPRGTGGARATL